MRKIVMFIAVLMGFSAVNAASDITLPGFGKRVKKQARGGGARPSATPSCKYLMAAPPRAVTRTPRAGETEMVDRLVGIDATLGNYSYTTTFEYDRYGFPLKQTNSNGGYTDYKYTWRVPGKIWATKCVRHIDGAGNEYVETDISRTFHANGAVATDSRVSQWNPRVVSEYDDKGNLLKRSSFYGDYTEVYTYTYIPQTGQWIEGFEGAYTKRFVEFVELDGNDGYMVRTMRLSDSVWRVSEEEGRWYDKKGRCCEDLTLSYRYEGDEVHVYGQRNKEEEKDGYIVRTESHLVKVVDGRPQWTEHTKTIESKNIDAPWVYKPGEVRTSEIYYRYEDGVWELDVKKAYTWVNDKVVKYEGTDWEEENWVHYFFVKDQELDNSRYIYFDEATGRYGYSEYEYEQDEYEDEYKYRYYTYCEADGQIISKFRRMYVYDEDYPTNKEKRWEVWKDNRWQKCTGTITVYDDETYVITFDDQSRMSVCEKYKRGKLSERQEYTYTEDGWIEKDYSISLTTGKRFLIREATCLHGGDDFFVFVYDDDGNLLHGDRETYDSVNKVEYYYNWEDGKWEFAYGSGQSKETLPDGTVITIERHASEYGKVDAMRKKVELKTPGYELFEDYEWDDERSRWYGTQKLERLKSKEFPVVDPVLVDSVADEYFFPVTDEGDVKDSEDVNVREKWYTAYWGWDDEKGEWYCYEPMPEISYPDEYTRIIKRKTDWESTEEKIIVDSERRKIEESRVTSVDGNETTHYRHTWAYDEKGRLVNDTEFRTDGDVWTYNYRYGTIEILSGVDKVVLGTAPVTVYNLQGVCVLRDASPEALKQLPGGLYIVNGKKIRIRK